MTPLLELLALHRSAAGPRQGLAVVTDPFGLPLGPCTRVHNMEEVNRRALMYRTLHIQAPLLLVLGPGQAQDEQELLARHTIWLLDPERRMHTDLGHIALRCCELLVAVKSPTVAQVVKNRYGRSGGVIEFNLPEPPCWTERPSP